MIESSKIKNNLTSYNALIFLFALILLLFIDLLVVEIKLGLILLTGAVLLMTVLIKPKLIYFLLLSLFSIEGFAALESVSYPKIVGFLLIVGLSLRLATTKEAIPKDNSYKYFFLFFIGGLVSFAFAKELSVSLQIYITYLSLFFLYIFTRYFLKNMRDINNALNYLFFSTLIIFALVQIMGFSVRENVSSRISSGIGDPNAFASYILVLLPLAFYRATNSSGISRISYWGCVVSFFLLLVFTLSRGGVLGFLGVAGVLIYHYSFRRMRQILFFILIIVAILYFSVPEEFWTRTSTITSHEVEDSAIETRIDNYRAALKMFLDYPLAGVGLSNFRFNSRNYGTANDLVVHNTYLEILTGGGVLTFIPFFLILLNCWRKLRIRWNYDNDMRDLIICLKASFVSILITSFFISGDHKKILWFLFALISSVYYIVINQKIIDKARKLQ